MRMIPKKWDPETPGHRGLDRGLGWGNTFGPHCTIPDTAANSSFVMTDLAQTINGNKTLSSTTNLSALTARGVLGLDASKNITSTTLTNGQLLIGSTSNVPVAATLTGTSDQLNLTNGAG